MEIGRWTRVAEQIFDQGFGHRLDRGFSALYDITKGWLLFPKMKEEPGQRCK